MSEIFISYAAEDCGRAEPLAAALREEGWDVWWDREIPLGKPFDEVIELAIAQARCVIVLWSATSVGSEWVRNVNIGTRMPRRLPYRRGNEIKTVSIDCPTCKAE